ncbi:MAG: clavaldehyde dehydrogenase [archaeon GW2011_AR17]|nr:MAG: clavaldehyde dehydrogenase [archaeon GW2011_AR17]MBS3154251.1 SDR family oxidoreductase [Candidatus Woesearchaeota archaeon]HIH14869.1 SDR family oxidoreductase [Nanoarchaeota archaeon]HIH58872.1 SDR family oxidoreductase [Nanoarchaeota archaeon]HII14038.1 SDR family oxidoreductase [Nanoarchaeota archaeon]
MAFLKNKVVVITGASSGIGEATALAFAREGCSVVLAARRLDKLKALEKKILSLDVACLAIQTDVSQQKEVQRLFSFVEKRFGRVDILVNNAGVGRNVSLENTSLKDWQSILDINLSGVFYCSQEVVRLMMKKHTAGHIITVSSVLGLIAMPGRSAYCASKHAVTGFKRSLRWELRKDHISVSIVHPAGVDTEILQNSAVERKKWKMLRSEDIAEYIIALASRDILRIVYVRILNVWRRFYYLVKYYPQ